MAASGPDAAKPPTSWPRGAVICRDIVGKRAWATAALAGAIFALAQPPFGLWPALIIAGPLLFWLWSARTNSPKAAFGIGLWAGIGHFSVALHWIIEPFLVDIAATGWMAPFALVLMSTGLACFWGTAFWLATRLTMLRPPGGAWAGVRAALLLALCISFAEFARSYVLTGFPWALATYIWTDTPVAQVASIIGPYGLTLLTLAAMMALGSGIGAGIGRFAPPALVCLLIAGSWVWGTARMIPLTPQEDAAVVRILQTNVEQRTKWAVENIRPNFDMLNDLSTWPGTSRPDLVIWPEAAVTFPLDSAAEARTEMAGRLQDEFGGASVITGSLRNNDGPDGEFGPETKWRNAMFLVDATGALSAPYDKIHLVPFGEYLPLGDLLAMVGIKSVAGIGAGIVAGDAPVLFRPVNAPPLAPLICYEMIFPRETAAAAEGADWLVLITNDAWFGEWAGPIQHLAMAQMRAIELGLPIARSANAGISAMIDPYGRKAAPHAPREIGVIDRALPESLPRTLYRDYGETLSTLIFCCFLIFATLGQTTATGTCKRKPGY